MSERPPLDSTTRRLLRHLSVRGAWLDPGDDGAAYRLVDPKAAASPLRFSADVVAGAARNGWLRDGEGRMTLTPAGADSLRRALAGQQEAPRESSKRAPSKVASATVDGPLRPRPRVTPPTAQTPGVDEAESPLGWLRRRKDKTGQPILSDEQFAAGERLRADVFFAGLGPRVTASWSSTAGTSGGQRSAPGGSAQMLDQMVAARQRVQHALRGVGPELSGILLDVCGFLKGLEVIEVERGWPPRSGKVVLVLALSRLADHYGLTKRASDGRDASAMRGPARIRHWGTEDYRPGGSAGGDQQGGAQGDARGPRPRITH